MYAGKHHPSKDPHNAHVLQHGKKLQFIATHEEGVTATFEDGTAESGTLLIGADGAHSVTRDWLFASAPEDAAMRHVPISSFNTLTKLSRETALSLRKIHPTYCITMDPNGLLTWFSLHDCTAQDPADWIFMIIITWNFDETEDHAALARDSDLLLDKVRALAEPLAYPFKAMVQEIPRGTKPWYSSRMSYWPTTPWDSRGGRVTLAGDAAHAMTFRKSKLPSRVNQTLAAALACTDPIPAYRPWPRLRQCHHRRRRAADAPPRHEGPHPGRVGRGG